MKKILVIEDDPVSRTLVSEILKKSGFQAIVAKNGPEGIELAANNKPDLVITDYQMPGMTGVEVLSRLKELNPLLPVIMLTAYGDASLTIKSMQSGAFDFIEKPINPKELVQVVRNGLKASENIYTSEQSDGDQRRKKDENIMVGKSPAMLSIFKNIGRISQNFVNVIISGGSGTGKERLAKLIHQSGPNAENTLTIISCKALSEDDFHRAFLGGTKSGTIVLDEVGSLSYEMQSFLLELLEKYPQHSVQGEGSNYRIISTTRLDIAKMAEQEVFLKELYYQLKVFTFHLPPLKERIIDVPFLVDHLIQELNQSLNKEITKIEDGIIPLFQAYDWPGNIRELKNVLMQAMVLSHGDLLQKKHIRIEGVTADEGEERESVNIKMQSLDDVEKEHIAKVLSVVGWNKQEAAATLGITRPTLNAKIDKYGLVRK
ncbi:MAG: sigma-54 dependent transcriptional regulator [Bacteroidales bacterium]|nr:sigma-54 dependent transcriptional regulator [Bacteroidales bacterium]